MKKQKRIIKTGIVAVSIISITSLIFSIIYFVKHLYLSALLQLLITYSNLVWIIVLLKDLKNCELIELAESVIQTADENTIYHRRTLRTVKEDVDKIIELSQKRMVNGLKDDCYISFINDVLTTINGFAKRIKLKSGV